MLLKLLEVASSFQDASTKARDVARLLEQRTMVRPHHDGGWVVLVESVPDRALLISKQMDEAEMQRGRNLYFDDDTTAPNEGYSSQEFSSDQDDWHRSYTDGWFYDD